ncbi:MAG: hypothetical protein DHS20C02_15360 [Micavibrio sp.]|nr:MAG: hypothetical protein DHS20C02_15360 [Micavibrio sp.]
MSDFPAFLQGAEQELNANIYKYDDFVRSRLRATNNKIGEVLLDILIEKTDGKYRKNQITPLRRHQLDQVMYIWHITDAGIYLQNPGRIANLNISHDFGEDIFESLDEMYDAVRERLPESQFKQEILNTVHEIDLMTKHYKGKQQVITDREHYKRFLKNPNTSAAKLLDHINNSSTTIGIPGKSIAEQAEDIDRFSLLYLHETYLAGDGKRYTYRDMATALHPDQAEFYEVAEKMATDVINIKRLYHEGYPKSQRPHKKIGVEMPEPEQLKSIKGFSDLPKILEPRLVVLAAAKKSLAAAWVEKLQLGNSENFSNSSLAEPPFQ